MPSYHEVRFYMGGLLLLIQGDARGLQRFDISDRGVLRSFLAVAWCVPAFLVGWVFRRLEYLRIHPQGGDALTTFLGKMVVVEAAQWLVPILSMAVLTLAFQFRPLLRTLIVTWNWFAVPLAYCTYMISAPVAFLSNHGGNVSAFTTYSSIALSLAILVGAMVLMWRLLTTIMGGAPWIRGATLLLVVFSQYLFVSGLESMMGVYAA
jgi:hypothetical protein